MKKVYVLSALLMAGSGVMAQSLIQQQVTAARQIPTGAGNAGIEVADTLGLAEFGDEAWLYSTQSGYLFGTNALAGEVQGIPITQLNYEFAAGYILNDAYNVTGALIYFGSKSALSASPSAVKVKMWSLADNKALGTAASTAPDAIGPNAVLKTATLPFADINVDANTIVSFPSAQWINEDFAISVDIKDLYNGTDAADTVAVYASAQGTSDGSYTWTNFGVDISPQTLWAISNATLQTPINVYLGIFAIVEESLASIEEQGFINGVKITTYPNPAITSDNVRFDYALESSAKAVEISIFDMNGKLVHSFAEGSRSAGTHTLNIPAGTVAAGSYIYGITADNKRIAKRMEVVK
jgi:hypothetical protein